GFDYAEYVHHQGIDVVASVVGHDGVRRVESGEEGWRWLLGNRIDRWRTVIRQSALESLRQPALGMFLGIIIGERGYLQQDLQEWFMTTGTVHLLSISGSHLGLVALVVFWIVRQGVKRLPMTPFLHMTRIITPSRFAIVITWPIVALYAWLAGAELATMRSLIMITLGLVALWWGYEHRLYHAVAAAALLIVVHNPRAIFDISFQLSFLSVLTIVHTMQWQQQVSSPRDADGTQQKPRLGSRVLVYGREAFLTSTVVTVGTLPLVALYFNQIPWMGIVTNLVAVPFTGGFLVPLGLVSAAWTVLSDGHYLLMRGILESSLLGVAKALRWCAELPGVSWYVAAPSLPTILLFYAGLVGVWANSIPRSMRKMMAVVVIALIGWWGVSPRLGVDGDHWRVTFLDVGQGDSAVLELPDGQTVLIDGGARYERLDMGRAVVAPFLWNRGITHLDHVVATHQQLDHVGGLIWVLSHIPVKHYWENGIERTEQFVVDLTATLESQGIARSIVVRGQDLLGKGPCTLTVLNPHSEEGVREEVSGRKSGTALNNQSIVLRLDCASHSLLFAADIEREGIARLGEEGWKPVTVVKVPHHGARSSLDYDWVRRIRPRYAVISAGRTNLYGHPVAEVLQAYAEVQASVSRTDRDGAIWIDGRLSSPDLTITRMRDRWFHPVSLRSCLVRCEKENWRRAWLQWLDRLT
ncbi:MAG: DNA internalization-related competence protein ComEC/Rec2, partial [Nitrospira sp.]